MVEVDRDGGIMEKNPPRDEVVLILPNKPDYVSVARLTVSGIANRIGFDIEDIEDIKLAVAEACTNAIKHGCCERNREYKVSFIVDEGSLTVTVADRGCGFETNDLKEPDFENPKEGGLGIFIIRTLMDEVDFKKMPDTGFTLTMKKYTGV